MYSSSSYAWAKTFMDSARSVSAGRPLANNTRLHVTRHPKTDGKDPVGGFGVVLHSTEVVTIYADGTYRVSTGGWDTNTTWDRIRSYCPLKGGKRAVYLPPNPSDPEPAVKRRTIPAPYVVADPGPEPVKSSHGCIAGTRETRETMTYDRVYEWRPVSPQTHVTMRDLYGKPEPVAHVAGVERIRYTEHYEWGTDADGFKPVLCPHCMAHAQRHGAWMLAYHGQTHKLRTGGYAQTVEMLDRFGDVATWRAAATEDFRTCKASREEHAAWVSRNTVPFYDGILLDSDGYVDTVELARIERERKRVERARRKAEREAKARRAAIHADVRRKIEAGSMLDDRALDWIADKGLTVSDAGTVTLYKRVAEAADGGFRATSGRGPFTYHVGQWAIAEDFTPERACGHGLHFAESPEATEYGYGPVILECEVPIVSIIPLGYKIKAERAFVVSATRAV